jgi:hypothetical protein
VNGIAAPGLLRMNALRHTALRRRTSGLIELQQRLVMLDRDGVINGPRKYNVKSPRERDEGSRRLAAARGKVVRLRTATGGATPVLLD